MPSTYGNTPISDAFGVLPYVYGAGLTNAFLSKNAGGFAPSRSPLPQSPLMRTSPEKAGLKDAWQLPAFGRLQLAPIDANGKPEKTRVMAEIRHPLTRARATALLETGTALPLPNGSSYTTRALNT